MDAATEPLLRLRVERLVAGGLGLARHDGRVVLIADAAPGDLLEAEPVADHRSYLRARTDRVLEPGPGRREPPCPLSRSCGGCTLQHLGHAAQVEAKRDILAESFARIGRLRLGQRPDAHASPEWAYRRRARFHVEPDGGGGARVGFRGRDDRRVVDIGPCPVLTPALEAALPALRAGVAASGLAGERTLLDTDDGVRGGSGPREGSIAVAGETLRVSADAFFQGNAPLLARLVARVVDLAGTGAGDGAPERELVELFAGVGLFTLPLARRFERVSAIEGDRVAAGLLRLNLARAGLGRVRVEASAVESALHGPAGRALGGAVVVLDPPRDGLSRPVRRALIERRPARIVYVACDPAPLARDAGELIRAGYRLDRLEMIDLFPQTAHLEAVARFEDGALLS